MNDQAAELFGSLSTAALLRSGTYWREVKAAPSLPPTFPTEDIPNTYHRAYENLVKEEFVAEIRGALAELRLSPKPKALFSFKLPAFRPRLEDEHPFLYVFGLNNIGPIKSAVEKLQPLEVLALTHASSFKEVSTPGNLIFGLVQWQTVKTNDGSPPYTLVHLAVNARDYAAFEHRLDRALNAFPVTACIPTCRILMAIKEASVPAFLHELLKPITEHGPLDHHRVFSHDGAFLERLAKLNASQQSAIRGIIHQPKAAAHLIQGPPGTGKTSTLAVLMLGLVEMGHTVLYTATTNVAAKGGLVKLLSTMGEATGNLHVQERELLLMGNRDKMQLDRDPELDRFHLETRVKRLQKAVKLLSGTFTECQLYYTGIPALGRDTGTLHNPWVSFRQDVTTLTTKAATSLVKVRDTLVGLVPATATIFLPSTSPGPSQVAMAAIHVQLESNGRDLQAALAELASAFRHGDVVFGSQAHLFRRAVLLRELDNTSPHFTTANAINKALEKVWHLLLQEAGKLYQWLYDPKELRIKWHEVLLSSARVVFSTVSTAGSNKTLSNVFPNCPFVLQDEATQACEASNLMLLKASIKGLVMVGDQCQLSALVHSTICKEKGYGRSLFERLIQQGYPSVMLDTQYRMHPAISKWPSAEFYSGKLLNGANVGPARSWHGLLPPLKIHHLAKSWETTDAASFSTINGPECDAIVQTIRQLIQHLESPAGRGNGLVTLGIVTFYKAQKALLIKRVGQLPGFGGVGEDLQYQQLLCVSINTVDGFQGQERDIIILSTVRSNFRSSISFISNARRLNVALTRAKHSLFVVGKVSCLEKNKRWNSFLQSAAGKGNNSPPVSSPVGPKMPLPTKAIKQATQAKPPVVTPPPTPPPVPCARAASAEASFRLIGPTATDVVMQLTRAPEWRVLMRRGLIQENALSSSLFGAAIDILVERLITTQEGRGTPATVNVAMPGKKGYGPSPPHHLVWSVVVAVGEDGLSYTQAIRLWAWGKGDAARATRIKAATSALQAHCPKYLTFCRHRGFKQVYGKRVSFPMVILKPGSQFSLDPVGGGGRDGGVDALSTAMAQLRPF